MLSDERKKEIEETARKLAEELDLEHREEFVKNVVEIQVSLDDELESEIDQYQQEASPFIATTIPYSPSTVKRALEFNGLTIKKFLNTIIDTASAISSMGSRIAFLKCVERCVGRISAKDVELEMRLKRITNNKNLQ